MLARVGIQTSERSRIISLAESTLSQIENSVKKKSFSDAERKVKLKKVLGLDIEKGITVNEDLLEEISIYYPEAEVDTKGNITVYYRTNKENAVKIKHSGIMVAKEDALFFSSKESGMLQITEILF